MEAEGGGWGQWLGWRAGGGGWDGGLRVEAGGGGLWWRAEGGGLGWGLVPPALLTGGPSGCGG